jgi:hypothetical protein
MNESIGCCGVTLTTREDSVLQQSVAFDHQFITPYICTLFNVRGGNEIFSSSYFAKWHSPHAHAPSAYRAAYHAAALHGQPALFRTLAQINTLTIA